MLGSFVGELYETFGGISDAALRKRIFNSFPTVIEKLELGEQAVKVARREMTRFTSPKNSAPNEW